jgi:hypothetical protein
MAEPASYPAPKALQKCRYFSPRSRRLGRMFLWADLPSDGFIAGCDEGLTFMKEIAFASRRGRCVTNKGP